MDNLTRMSCEITQASDLEPLHNLHKFPVFMGCTQQNKVNDKYYDMEWVISRSSGAIQLKKLIPLNILYPEQHQAGTVGNLWAQHHKEFAQFIHSFRVKNVVEIGGAHGILSKEYSSLDNIPWTIIEPNPSPVEDCTAKFIKGFFDSQITISSNVDTIVHSHVLEHIYHPRQFIKDIYDKLNIGNKLIFSVPNLKEMLMQNYANALNFEHTIYISEEYIEYLLSEFGFKVLQKKFYLNDHSIFYAVEKIKEKTKLTLRQDLYEKNKSLFLDHINNTKSIVDHINKKIQAVDGPIFLFGAHIFSQYLIAYGLDTKNIINILDNEPLKHNSRLYGTDLIVTSPKILNKYTSPNVILRAGVYNTEIKNDILKNINKKTNFIQ
jgi:predicted SAM-dependent methyltransferase